MISTRYALLPMLLLLAAGTRVAAQTGSVAPYPKRAVDSMAKVSTALVSATAAKVTVATNTDSLRSRVTALVDSTRHEMAIFLADVRVALLRARAEGQRSAVAAVKATAPAGDAPKAAAEPDARAPASTYGGSVDAYISANNNRPPTATNAFHAFDVIDGRGVRDGLVDTSAKRPDSAPKVNSAPPTIVPLLGIKMSGYVESAFNRSTSPNGGAIVGRLYERTNNQFSLNALKLSLDRPYDATKVDAGFHADMVFGQNATVLQSTGFNLGPNGDVYQLYGTLNLPTANGNGVQFKVGRMATFLGLELIETPLNPNVSIGNAFLFVENFTQTGVSVEHRFNAVIDAQVRVLNGWDQVQDVNNRLSYMARVGVTPDANTSVAFSAYTGPEQADNNTATRCGVEVLASRKVGKVTTYLQADAGQEKRNSALPDPENDATWWAGGAWIVIDATPKVGVALRGDYLADRAAARTGGAFSLPTAAGHRLSSATGTLNIKAVSNVLIRPELRYDRSNMKVFANHSSQFTIGLSAAYVF